MTIYDIAQLANVSASTVSRVINNKPGVGAETRARIKKILEEYSYKPNQAARDLVNQTSNVVGILISDISSVHHSMGAHLINIELQQRGFHSIMISSDNSDESISNSFHIFLTRSVDGIILLGSSFQNSTVIQEIKQNAKKIPIVIVNGMIDLPNVLSIISNEKAGVFDAVELLRKKGKKRIAFVIDTYTPSNLLKKEGYISGMAKHFPETKPIVQVSKSDINSAYEVTKDLIKQYKDVDGIIFAIDLLAAGGLRAVIDYGKKIPEDIAIIGIDNSIYSKITYPTLSSVDNQILDLSKKAVHELFRYFEVGKTSDNLIIPTKLIEREST